MSTANFKYDLGAKAKCRVTGYVGIITCRMEWLYGCRRYALQSDQLKDGSPVSSHYLDEGAIDLLEQPAVAHQVQDTGGDAPAPRRNPDPSR